MVKMDKIRLAIIAAVVAAAAYFVWAPNEKINLGLDLRGGAHIVLRAVGADGSEVGDEDIEKLVAVLRNRIDQYGIVEPQIQREGSDRVAVDLPGVEDPEAALDLIGRTAVLEFRKVEGAGPSMPPAVDRRNYASDEAYERAKSNWEELNKDALAKIEEFERQAREDKGVTALRDERGSAYLLGETYVTGGDLVDARVTYDEIQKPAVSLKFSSAGAEAFDKATAANIDRQIAIVLDGVVISAPVVRSRISGGEAQISGSFTPEEAARLSVMLRAGALPVAVEVLENRSVGPTLGEDSVRSGLRAGMIGAGLVCVFMILYYGLRGIAADLALAASTLVLVAVMVFLRSTLTLPGIGGIILTLGMAVDGNILIYERIKEESRSGKTAMAALESGFRKALTVILDSNVTTLIASAVLFYFGSGPVRGFAVTLSLGVLTAMFGNLVVTRAILRLVTRKGAAH